MSDTAEQQVGFRATLMCRLCCRPLKLNRLFYNPRIPSVITTGYSLYLTSSVWRTSVSFPRSPSRVGRHRALGKDLPWVKRCTTWRGHRGWPGNYRKFDEGGEATVSALLPGPFHGSHRVGAFPLHRALHSVSGVVRSSHPGGFECSLGTFFLREACVSKFPSLLVAVNDCVAENT